MKIFYISAGAANIIGAHRAWSAGNDDPSQVSVTFSSQVAEVVRDLDAQAFFLSFGRESARLEDGRFILEHRPWPARSGIAYHVGELRRATAVAIAARRFGADIALVDSGSLAWFALPLLRAAGIPVLPILHNSLWPAGATPRGGMAQVKGWLDRAFWRSYAGPVLVVSEEARRQVEAVRGDGRGPILRFRPLFRPDYFAGMPPVPPPDAPIGILFVGRAVREKGLLLLPEIARLVEDRRPGAARWIVCGDGPDLPALREAVAASGLEALFDVRGWTTPAELPSVYRHVHATIVPTTSGFSEGLALTAVEAVLAGRPVITNQVVPALDDLLPAAMTTLPDDVETPAAAVTALIDDPALYTRLCEATAGLGAPFLNPANGLRTMLHEALALACPRRHSA